jgi:hypothetical protein
MFAFLISNGIFFIFFIIFKTLIKFHILLVKKCLQNVVANECFQTIVFLNLI